jgi:glycosyltransferase involved in cell wall biosynthesis
MVNNTKIFIHIAAYRDPELIPTIKSALSRAQYPKRLYFGICLQETDEAYKNFPYKNNDNFRIIYIPYNESKGCCWARKLVDKLYNDEDYVLQIDSHMRFIPNWDTELIKYLHKCPSEKAILSTYVAGYTPRGLNDRGTFDLTPFRIKCDRFDNGLIVFSPIQIQKHKRLNDQPQPTMFMAGGFIFTYGSWKKEIPYDSSIYFVGEEHTLALRSFTHGWDIYYPPINILYHLYTRKGASRHWDDHKKWYDTDCDSKKCVHSILVDGKTSGKYGIGKVRTIDQYQKLAGVNYKTLTLTQNAQIGLLEYPANSYKLNNLNSLFYVDNNDNKIWHEVKLPNKEKFATFSVISVTPDIIILYDETRKIYLKLDKDKCSWKKSSPSMSEWNLCDYGTFVHKE